jgi:uncharacterized protein (TIGR03086 family)
MSDREAAAMIGGVMLLERAMNYTLGSLALVTDGVLDHPTPCAGWNVHRLLVHMNESLAALCEAADTGWVDLVPNGDGRVSAGLAQAVRARACRLLSAWIGADGPSMVAVGGRPLPSTVIAGAGAIEIAVHGWDLAIGCGHHRPIPATMATELLDLAELMVTAADRPGRFAHPVAVPRDTQAADRLLAYLGRDPAMAPA